ncbi:MAG TPA: hypothetical protein VLW75_11460, partial [Rhizomicrobium sp.]|nr:hypothetical protein [Rhizomicrobium sp.]
RGADFGVIVACHDVPGIAEASDPRVTFLVSRAPVPATLEAQMYDKHVKRRMIAAELRERGGGYLMAVDADDLVSSRLASFVRQDANPYGYILHDGYEFDFARKRVRPAPRFNRFCGSSGIFLFSPDDLPKSFDDADQAVSDRFGNHTQWAQAAKELGRPLAAFPFRGAMYVTNNGENHSAQAGNVGWRRSLLRAFTPSQPLTQELRAEFALRD